MIFVVLMCCHVVAVSESQLCIANGSKYQVKVCYAQETQTANSPDTSSPDNNAFKGHSPTTADNPNEADKSFVVDIGDVSAFVSVRYLSIFLWNTETTQVLKGWKPEPGSGNTSIIVTEEGGVQFGNADTEDSVWFSRPKGVNHRPRKSFVANASESILTVTSATGDGKRNVQPGETTTVEYEDIVISFGNESIPVKRKTIPRTSVVVKSPENIRVTGQLYGDNIDDLKWNVDGEKCKPLSYREWLEPPLRAVGSVVASSPAVTNAVSTSCVIL